MVVIGLLMGCIALIVPLAILVLIISAVMKKSKDNKANFEDSVRNIYVYIILIITLIALIIGIIASLRVGLDVILPEESIYQNSYSNKQIEKNENIIELFTTLSLVFSVLPIFIYHNKLAKNSRINKIDNQNVN